MAPPPIEPFFDMAYGDAWQTLNPETVVLLQMVGAASGISFCGNPPYDISDFVAWFPRFGSVVTTQTTTTAPSAPGSGVTLAVESSVQMSIGDAVLVDVASNFQTTTTGAVSAGTNVSVPVVSSTNFKVGAWAGIDNGEYFEQTTIASIPDGTHIVLSQLGINHASGVALISASVQEGTKITAVPDGTHITVGELSEYHATGVPVVDNDTNYTGLLPEVVLNSYICLAAASLPFQKWQDDWKFGMALFIAHYATLWLQSEGEALTVTNMTAKQAASQGIARGIAIAKAVGGVSVSYEIPEALKDWGSFGLTIYGQQFIDRARTIGSGPIFVL